MIEIYDKAPEKLHMPGTFCRAYHVLMPRITASNKKGTEVKFQLKDLEKPTIEDMEYLPYFDGERPRTPPQDTWVLGKLQLSCSRAILNGNLQMMIYWNLGGQLLQKASAKLPRLTR